ncbi:opacity protein-like surface antigen [Rhodoblastus acidophilus]|uniref:outer membrane beta-barrel protein n=1 Tax=Rhodoblastus acidophilus TaxID=1074 RepID=UPI0022249B93|nr:outer membrane beta-barrel protein [Rhodoblastus acidophilus]MCW2285747.1 opacity protein-like surface antigen [Rhodoblastus acidophilus]MCW2333119.1 opacity protein-like surface antigen [Rhodoblastus acidophilus]
MLCLLGSTLLSSSAFAADVPSLNLRPAMDAEDAGWEGAYAGLNYGTALGTTQWSNPTGDLLLAATPRFPASGSQVGILGGLTIGYNFRLGGPWVVGVEGDIDATSLSGAAVCGGVRGAGGVGWACTSAQATLATLDARLGYALGGLLLFTKGGLAYAHEKLSIGAFNPYGGPNPSISTAQDTVGYNAGGGVEYALGGGWSAKAEYDYYGLRKRSFAAQDAGFAATYGASARQTASVAKFGLNRHWGAGEESAGTTPGLLSYLSGEFGARVGWGGGRYRYNLYDNVVASQMNSRLTWPASGVMTETFGRVDTPLGVYLKGMIGGIALADGGTMRDEDFVPALDPYSHTVSQTRGGSDVYGAFDLGYAFSGGGWRVGPFAGYSYLEDRQNAYGCTQVASNPDMCSPPGVTPPMVAANQLTLSRVDKWNALRIGLAGDVKLGDRFKFAAEAAWLPYANVDGSLDNHWLRPDINPQADRGHGSGYQLEAVLSYLITDRVSAGVGGRYWSMSADGSTRFPWVSTDSPTKVSVDRAMAFGQVSYAFGWRPAPEPVVAKF